MTFQGRVCATAKKAVVGSAQARLLDQPKTAGFTFISLQISPENPLNYQEFRRLLANIKFQPQEKNLQRSNNDAQNAS